MPEENYAGLKVMFKLGRFQVQAYMTKRYYNVWKYFRDTSIKDVEVEEVELPSNQFYNGVYENDQI